MARSENEEYNLYLLASSYNLFNAAGEILKVRFWIWMLASTVKTWRYSLREWTRKLVDEASRRKHVFGCLLVQVKHNEVESV